jgi:hypothetical protein
MCEFPLKRAISRKIFKKAFVRDNCAFFDVFGGWKAIYRMTGGRARARIAMREPGGFLYNAHARDT